jgi:hypothetical protein
MANTIGAGVGAAYLLAPRIGLDFLSQPSVHLFMICYREAYQVK